MQLDYFTVMAARSAASPARWRRPFLRWLDGIEKGWGIPLLIAAFAAVWLLFLMIAYLSGDLHADALEAWVVGRDFAWGNAKHPPLMGWIAFLWTLVFPLTDWSIQLLAMTNAAVALWAVDLIARRFVRGDQRAVVLLLLMLLPAYQFHAQRFNANTVLLAVWPLATYCFLRAFETRTVAWSAAAGAMAALVMLGKYYSVFLVGSFALAALMHPQRRLYFRSWSPVVSTLTGLAVLGPHLYWLATTGATPFSYAMQVHGGVPFRQSLVEAAMFLLGLAATMALPALVWILSAETRLARFVADFRAMNPGLVLLFWILFGTVALPVVTTVALGTDMPSLWALQGLFLVAILIVCGASFALERLYVVNMMVFVGGIALLAVTVAAPIHAIYRNDAGANDRTYYRLAAMELTRRWHDVAHVPLPAVSGDDPLAFATAFYSPDHPRYSRPFRHQYKWGMPRVTTLDKGWAAMCFADNAACLGWMASVTAIAPRYSRVDFTVTPQLWGRPGRPASIAALMVLPVAAGQPAPSRVPADDVGASQRHR
ncbi:glycosyltransferase family 39 protein [Rhodopseudomonas sp. P2A-2r]|uniref:glycosyltransferase family 39 protein n=1 Tax=unclassified Rhodopseudomonas TaxID=2638247 RepID=UPI0029FF04C2|nr:glycosyltransferase family 39 protein [Rhodopseudomonas sp. P2A-2r]